MKTVDYIRNVAQLTGTKVGCAEGGCGACGVLLTAPDPLTGKLTSHTVNSCLHSVAALDGQAITTTEGIGNSQVGFDPIQARLAAKNGSQCGFCSPGMVMSMYGLLQENPNPTHEEIEARFDGNLCRCTGYRDILEAMHTFGPSAKDPSSAAAALTSRQSASLTAGQQQTQEEDERKHVSSVGSACSAAQKRECKNDCGTCNHHSVECGDMEDLLSGPYDLSKRGSKFPPALKHYKPKPYYFADTASDCLWFSVFSTADIFTLLETYSDVPVRIVVGNTSVGVIKYYPPVAGDDPQVFIDVTRVVSLKSVQETSSSLEVGAAVTITDLVNALQGSASKDRNFAVVARHLLRVANYLVRNAACWAGNIMLAKTHPDFPSDVVATLCGAGATLAVTDKDGAVQHMSVPAFLDFALPVTSLVTSLSIPKAQPNVGFDSSKVALRHSNAHALVNSSFRFEYSSMCNGAAVIQKAFLMFGNLTRGPFFAPKTTDFLVGKALNADTLKQALAILQGEAVCTPATGHETWVVVDPAYRQSLAQAMFYKFVLGEVNRLAPTSLSPRLTSAANRYIRPVSNGTQAFTPDATTAPVGQPIPKLTATLQASGEARYTSDIVPPVGTLFGCLVLSTSARAKIASIDAVSALAVPGVHSVMTAATLAAMGANNNIGQFPGDEELFASTDVYWVGQPVGMVLADSQATADAAAKDVVVNYTAVSDKPIFTILDAIAANAIFPDNDTCKHIANVAQGDVDKAWAAAEHKIEVDIYTPFQYHFFMETHSAVASLGEEGAVDLSVSTQDATYTRQAVATAIRQPLNKVNVQVKRVGGAFGGKLSRQSQVAVAATMGAKYTGRSVKIHNDRRLDTIAGAKRQQYLARCKVGYDKDGAITCYWVKFYQNQGYTYDIGFGCSDMCLMWADQCYNIPNFKVEGIMVRTNLPPGTAMRAPGVVNSAFVIEQLIETVASNLKVAPMKIREKNFYALNDVTPYQEKITDFSLDKVWQLCKTNAGWEAEQKQIDSFNSANRWRKRGHSMTPVKYGMSVSDYKCKVLLSVNLGDGSITLNHSGVEMGQGINTKVVQTVAYELGRPVNSVVVTTTSTDIAPDCTGTGGSGTSETTCSAALNACATLKAALLPYRKNPSSTWEEVITAAYNGGVSLTVTGYHAAPATTPFTYFVWAAAYTQVELDVLTGELEVLKTDIVYDCGNSLNPLLDIGQAEGAFIQGLGLLTCEEVVFDDQGRLRSEGTWEYKPPFHLDIPQSFNITFLDKNPNMAPGNILSSKASGEPPAIISHSVFFALTNCVKAALNDPDSPSSSSVSLQVPATAPRIQRACLVSTDQLTF
eukprot:CAMPEP_0175123580 /NCGR_PEP_ID=MMETSP0087-20121206/2322_1 /TAXON_ID=136419 /ORGANISM="Unknown Unknown, Strain D1" /LENGTH=1330 /DNA_ID=CAMNT_0016405287 /DNA_START=389 /DNA_END=4381 /DNA_ORIENTATION=-